MENSTMNNTYQKRLMRSLRLYTVLLITGILSSPLGAAILVTDDFETGVGSWTSHATFTSDTAQAHRGTKSAKWDNSGVGNIDRTFAGVTGAIKSTFWIYDAGTTTRYYGETRSATPQVFAVGKNNATSPETLDSTKYQGRIYNSASQFFNCNATGSPNRSTGWHKHVFERLSDGVTCKYYVDDILCKTFNNAAAATFTMVRLTSPGVSGTGFVWFDDVMVETPDANGNYFGTITAQPLSTTKAPGESVTFTVQVADNGSPSLLSYQWFKGTTALSGKTSSSLTISSVVSGDAGDYKCEIYSLAGLGNGSACKTTSAVATLTVAAARKWTGGGSDDNWSTADNWGGTSLALSGEDVVFSGSTRLTPNMDNNYDVSTLSFDSTAGAFTIEATAGKILSLSGNITQNSATPQTLNTSIAVGSTRAINTASGNLTIGGTISGVGGITKSGSSTLTLNAANTYAGASTISAGTLRLGVANAIPSGAGKGNFSLTGTLDLNGFSPTLNGLSGAGTVDNLTGSGAYTLTLGANDQSSTFAGVIKNSAGIVSIEKIGTGTLTFSGANSFSGDIKITSGNIDLGSANVALGGGALVFNGGNLTANSSANVTLPNPVRLMQNTVISGAGATASPGGNGRYIQFMSSDVTASGGKTLTIRNIGGAASTLFNVDFRGDTFTWDNPIVVGNASDSGKAQISWMTDVTNGVQTVNGKISGPGSVRRTDNIGTPGATIFTAANDYSGGTWNNGGFIGFGSDCVGTTGNITSGPIGTGTLTINDDPDIGFFASGGPRTLLNPITFDKLSPSHPLVIKGSQDLTLAGNITLGSSNITVQVDNTGLTKISGAITSTKVITKTGSGTLILSGNNNQHSGGTTLSAGLLRIENTAALGTGTFTILGNGTFDNTSGGPLTLANSLTLSASPTFSGSSDLRINGNATVSGNNRTITVSGGTLTLGGNIGENGVRKLTKAGTGVLVIEGIDSHTGGTTVSGGTLNVNGNSTTSSITVDAMGTLGGSGVVGVVALNGIVSPGNAVGTLAAGSMTWNGNATYLWEVDNSANDLLNLASLNIAATAGSKFNLNITALAKLTNWNSRTAKQWVIAHTTGGITGFDPAKFALTDNFAAKTNSLGAAGYFSVAQSDNDLVLNYNPLEAVDDTVLRTKGQPVKVSMAELLANDAAVGAVITSVSGAPHGTVTTNAGWIFYVPTEESVSDSFDYTLTDANGKTATATVTITTEEKLQTRQLTTSGPGEASFYGIPETEYMVEYTDSLAPAEWQTLLTVGVNGVVTTDSNGKASFKDPAEFLPAQRYYRILYIPAP